MVQKNGLLRIRPGHLANFSGGAGYMPFVTILSVPASLIGVFVGYVVLHLKSKSTLRELRDSDDSLHPTELTKFFVAANKHLKNCLLITLLVGSALFFFGMGLVYQGSAMIVVYALFYSFGPLLAWVLSTWVLVRQIYKNGVRISNLVFAAEIYLLIMIGWIFIANRLQEMI